MHAKCSQGYGLKQETKFDGQRRSSGGKLASSSWIRIRIAQALYRSLRHNDGRMWRTLPLLLHHPYPHCSSASTSRQMMTLIGRPPHIQTWEAHEENKWGSAGAGILRPRPTDCCLIGAIPNSLWKCHSWLKKLLSCSSSDQFITQVAVTFHIVPLRHVLPVPNNTSWLRLDHNSTPNSFTISFLQAFHFYFANLSYFFQRGYRLSSQI
jgi:hypothetical protein